MICKFCGDEFAGDPVMQNGEIYCSLGCADMDSEIDFDEDTYSERDFGIDSDDDLTNDDEDLPY